MTLSSGTKIILAALAVAAPRCQGFLSQRPLIHSNVNGRSSFDTSSEYSAESKSHLVAKIITISYTTS